MKKRIFILLAILPLLVLDGTSTNLAFGKAAKQYDWYLVVKEFKGKGEWVSFTCKPGDLIYIQNIHRPPNPNILEPYVDICIFDSNGKYKDWYWLTKGLDKITNDEYCRWVKNEKSDL